LERVAYEDDDDSKDNEIAMLDVDLNLHANHDFDLNELPNEKDKGLEERELHEEDEGLEEKELPNEENEVPEENKKADIRQEVDYMLQIIVPKYFE
jgi:hypothetical protein